MSFNLTEGESDFTQFQVSNAGGGVLLWTVSSDQPWIALSPERGGNDETVVVIVDAGGMEEGMYEGSVTIKSPAGTEECPVYLSVKPSYKNQNPVLELSPDPLSFYSALMEGESGYEEFEISNGGEGILEWEMSADEPWITLSPESGTNSETVTVTVNAADLIPGEYNTTFGVDSNGGYEEGTVNLIVPERPEGPDLVTYLQVTGPVTRVMDEDSYYYFAVPISVVVRNQGNKTADIFNVSTEYTSSSGTYTAPFRVPRKVTSGIPIQMSPLIREKK